MSGSLTDVAGLTVGHFTDSRRHRLQRGAVPARAPSAASTCAAPRRARARPTCCVPTTWSSRCTLCSSAAERLRPGRRQRRDALARGARPRRGGRPAARADRAGGGALRPRGAAGRPSRRGRRRCRLRGGARRRRAAGQRRRRRRRHGGQAVRHRARHEGRHRHGQLRRPAASPSARWWPSTPPATSSTRRAGPCIAGPRPREAARARQRAGCASTRRRSAWRQHHAGVVATDAELTKAEATKLARMAHDGLARTHRPGAHHGRRRHAVRAGHRRRGQARRRHHGRRRGGDRARPRRARRRARGHVVGRRAGDPRTLTAAAVPPRARAAPA